jgi:hypothetical protein
MTIVMTKLLVLTTIPTIIRVQLIDLSLKPIDWYKLISTIKVTSRLATTFKIKLTLCSTLQSRTIHQLRISLQSHLLDIITKWVLLKNLIKIIISRWIGSLIPINSQIRIYLSTFSHHYYSRIQVSLNKLLNKT